MKKILTLLMFVFVIWTPVFAQDALAIVERSRSRIQAESTSIRYRIVIQPRTGAASERVIDQYSKRDPQGNMRSLVVFQAPATVAGTRFLSIENPGRANDQWIFLPSLGRIRRIAAAEGSSSFIGDFSYDDISSADRKSDLDRHRVLREEAYLNLPCYVIESIPLESSYQYSMMIQWIDQENYITRKIELYDRRGTLVKVLEILELSEVQGRLSPSVTRMSTLAAGTSTTLHVVNLRYDDPIPESAFTTGFLETGRW
ncbi:MAG: outer membrane lipoprotein-sorting protein [Treponema sp.]|nr:outer membrane lipoprotein-sorting protein [Treponema sp.]